MRRATVATALVLALTSPLLGSPEEDAERHWEEVALNGGIATAFALDPDGPVYARTKNYSLYFSTDRGRAWDRIESPWGPGGGFLRIAVAPSGRLIAAGTEPNGWWFGVDCGLARSDDHGASWEMCLDSLWAECLCVTSDGHVFAGGFGVIWHSTDEGESWHESRQGLASLWVTSLARNPSGTLFAGVNDPNTRLRKSTDSGLTWEPTAPSGVNHVRQLLCRQGGELFAVGPYALSRSSDGGSSWHPASGGLPPGATEIVEIRETDEGLLLAATDAGLYGSSNSGETWERRGDQLAGRYVRGLAVGSQGEVFAGVSPEGVLLSSDAGLNWEVSNAGLSDVIVWGIVASQADNLSVAGQIGSLVCRVGPCSENAVYSTSDGGRTWPSAASSPEGDLLTATATGELLIVNAGCGELYCECSLWKSEGPGCAWTPASHVLMASYANIALEQDGSILLLTDVGLFRSRDQAESWDRIPLGWERIPEGIALTGLAVSDSGRIYLMQNDFFADQGILLESTDRGITWDAVAVFGYRVAHSVHAGRGSELFLDGEAIRRSTDRGASWTILQDGDGEQIFSAFARSGAGDVCWGLWPGEQGDLLEVGLVFYLPAGTSTPVEADAGLPRRPVSVLAFSTDNQLYAGCCHWSGGASGLFRLVTTPSGIATDGSVAGSFVLSQNFPNPFNPVTTVEYSLPQAGFASLRVYNVVGEEVATLVDGQHDAGRFTTIWDASGLPSGVYFYRLTSGSFIQTMKAVLMR